MIPQINHSYINALDGDGNIIGRISYDEDYPLSFCRWQITCGQFGMAHANTEQAARSVMREHGAMSFQLKEIYQPPINYGRYRRR